ncbi:MAG: sulfurtransferase-like selenium metabolism protein YedF [Desulfobacterales bacterium]|nr:sulfurtransferase-like selenium metabolism protein YedF [Desulfobacterales bacterium]
MTQVDARKLACPSPVLMTKEAIESNQPGEICVIVDNEASSQNVTRFLESQSYTVTVETKGAEFKLTGVRGEGGEKTETLTAPEKDAGGGDKKIMVMVSTDRMGYGDDELGLKLMINFLKTIGEMGDELWRLVFVNNGVKLAVIDSEVLDVLKNLESDGVHIMVCGTCLTHFDLLDQKRVGETTNMLDIVTAMQAADKVINI